MGKKAVGPKSDVSKSQAIRNYQKENPGAGPQAVAKALAKDGVKVTAAFVSTVKSMDKRRAERLEYADVAVLRGFGEGEAGELSLGLLFKAKRLVEELGGIQEARLALEALARLTK